MRISSICLENDFSTMKIYMGIIPVFKTTHCKRHLCIIRVAFCTYETVILLSNLKALIPDISITFNN